MNKIASRERLLILQIIIHFRSLQAVTLESLYCRNRIDGSLCMIAFTSHRSEAYRIKRHQQGLGRCTLRSRCPESRAETGSSTEKVIRLIYWGRRDDKQIP